MENMLEDLCIRVRDAEEEEVSVALRNMIGAKIIDAGFIPDEREGGMAFDYEQDGEIKRLVLGYNELGEWVKFHDKVQKD